LVNGATPDAYFPYPTDVPFRELLRDPRLQQLSKFHRRGYLARIVGNLTAFLAIEPESAAVSRVEDGGNVAAADTRGTVGEEFSLSHQSILSYRPPARRISISRTADFEIPCLILSFCKIFSATSLNVKLAVLFAIKQVY